MTSNETTDARFTVKHARAVADHFANDGHGLWTAQSVADGIGLPLDAAKRWEHAYESDGSFKGSIWDENGKPVKKVRAVYALDVVESVAHALGITSELRGRGFRCRGLCADILNVTESMPHDMGIDGVWHND